jgi:hypothetical protein
MAYILPGPAGEDAELRERSLIQALAILRGTDNRRRALDEREYLVMLDALHSGGTWGQIADALGWDPESAQDRFHVLQKLVSPSGMENDPGPIETGR